MITEHLYVCTNGCSFGCGQAVTRDVATCHTNTRALPERTRTLQRCRRREGCVGVHGPRPRKQILRIRASECANVENIEGRMERGRCESGGAEKSGEESGKVGKGVQMV